MRLSRLISYLIKMLIMSVIICVMMFTAYSTQVMCITQSINTGTLEFIGLGLITCVIVYSIITVPFGVKTMEELQKRYSVVSRFSKRVILFMYIVFGTVGGVFYLSQFYCDESFSSSCWNSLNWPDMTITIVKSMPRFYRDLVYIPLSTGEYVPDSTFYMECIVFVLLLLLTSLAALPIVEYQTYKTGCIYVNPKEACRDKQ